MSEISDIFQGLPARYVGANIRKTTRFYFSLDEDEKWTVVMNPGQCEVVAGNDGEADCFFKGTKAMFLEVWNGRYMPSVKDFLLGTIKSNNPMMLRDFYAAFQKQG